jgi:anthranilate phosphoribosyltransferase
MMIKEGIQKLVTGMNLTYDESREIMKEIMSGNATQAQIAAFITALRMKGETVDEISALASVMREFCQRINPKVDGRLVDTCGTGGDLIKTFNVSTTSAFVVAGAGVAVAKHGNRSVTSKSGSADMLEKFGLNLNLEPEAVEKTIEEVGIGFMFAPAFHPAMKYAIEPRREIGVRTVFNVLGPLTNPANANAQLLGVYEKTWLEPIAHVLKNLGCEEAMVVHGLDGLDEISTIGGTAIARLKNGKISLIEVKPQDFGVKQSRPEDIGGTTPDQSAEITYQILNESGETENPKRDIVLVNAAAGIMVGGKAEDFCHGVELAKESIDSGAAYKKLKALVKASGGNASRIEEMERKYG